MFARKFLSKFGMKSDNLEGSPVPCYFGVIRNEVNFIDEMNIMTEFREFKAVILSAYTVINFFSLPSAAYFVPVF